MENTKDIAKKYLTSVLDLDLEDSTLNDDSNGVIEKQLLPHAYGYQNGKLGEPNPCIDMELYPRQCDNGKLIHARVKRLVVDVDGKTIGLTNEKVFNN